MTNKERHKALLTANTSRCNKMHLAAEWKIPWVWEGEPPDRVGVMKSRMLFFIDGYWCKAKSFDEDIRDGGDWAIRFD